MNVAQYVLKRLHQVGVERIYGYPGAAIIPILEAIDRFKKIKWVLCRSEMAAAMAASAEAKLTGKLTVCLTTTGPGASNALTGMLDAQLDRVPVLIITGMPPLAKQEQRGFQDLNQVKLFDLLGMSVEAKSVEQFPMLFENILGFCYSHFQAAHLALSVDIQSQSVKWSVKHRLKKFIHHYAIDKAELKKLANELMHEKKVLLAVGLGASNAGRAIEALALRLNVPIISSISGKGIISNDFPNYRGVLGVYGLAGMASAKKAMQQAEVIIGFGLKNLWSNELLKNKKLILCSHEPNIVHYGYAKNSVIFGDLAKIAKNLTSYLKHYQSTHKKIAAIKQPHSNSLAAVFMKNLSHYLSKDTVVSLDVGDNSLWALHYLTLHKNQRILCSNRLGTMGFALPAAIAVKLANKKAMAVCICGDGGFQMLLSELGTILQYQLKILIVVVNNGRLARVSAQEAKQFGVELDNPDFTQLAQSYGLSAFCLREPADMTLTLQHALAALKKSSVLIEVVDDDSNAFAPMKM